LTYSVTSLAMNPNYYPWRCPCSEDINFVVGPLSSCRSYRGSGRAFRPPGIIVPWLYHNI